MNAKKAVVLVVAAFVLLFFVNSPKASRGLVNDGVKYGMKYGSEGFDKLSSAIKSFTGHND